MTDKQIIIDPCDKCDVEPPALKFKCPTCEYNKENKQIIIDGVDVSGCKYYVENNGVEAQGCYELTDLCECNKENEFCYNNPNCYYKQLKRKEQECEEKQKTAQDAISKLCAEKSTLYNKLDQLKAENDTLFKAIEEVNKINKKLESKNDELKEFQNLLEEQMKFNKSELELSLSSEIERSEFLIKEFKKADKQRDNWREKAEKFKQTLTEIKQLLEDAFDTDKTSAEQSFDNFYKAIKLCEVLDE